MSRALSAVWALIKHRLFCRHEYIRRYERHCIYLECLHCGRETEGWLID